MDLNEVVS